MPKTDVNSTTIEKVSYGFCAFFTTVLNIGIGIIIGSFFDLLKNYLLFLCFFFPIRCLHKGFHCTKLSHCIIATNILFISSAYISKIVNSSNINYFIFLIVLFFHYLCSTERNSMFHIIEIMIFCFLKIIKSYLISYLLISILLNTFLIMGGKLNEKLLSKKFI